MTSRMKPTFGGYIRRVRQERNLTLTQLAAMLKLDSANLSKIENDKRIFDEKKLGLLSKAVSISEIELKKEYYSSKLAYEIFDSGCSTEILKLAERKLNYLKTNFKEIAI